MLHAVLQVISETGVASSRVTTYAQGTLHLLIRAVGQYIYPFAGNTSFHNELCNTLHILMPSLDKAEKQMHACHF